MVKIKTKKKMTLPELIQWGWDNPELVKGKLIKPKSKTFEGVHFLVTNRVMTLTPVSKYDIFTVEIEEEITEDTVITNLVEVYEYNEIMESAAHGECSITNALGEEVDDVSRLAFYMLNDDLSMTLLWKNGEMVE
ncbi:hypothetical protein MTQ94_06380 [Staphylococcus agnetis]|uniref:hypothetical protein n=1 Tax=Staphylococcus agnetis TaxID=985762 RepID=UPI000D027817|nr:hypothetical protein [Staphylococcus agnetis]MCO4339740.1 hypothetical protein [Staphylococcus agnetis]MCO4341422.1 hypothetical protein [Staphylococcus agnetis]MCO4343409.1 hypothetical protein [Staphylococcus agnetis]MCO4348486.1 hypothetical protein [Staphylococcus agnetis]MCO4350792.1 hypothetical protein [Staphylococcus agnetis]